MLAVASVALASWYAPITHHLTLYAVMASPLLALAAPVAIIVLLWGRQWVAAGLAGCLTVVLIVVQLPWFISSDPDPSSVAIRVMTINMRYGQADPTAIAAVADANADVVMIQELTPEAVRALSAAGFDTTYPHRALDARPAGAGVGFYSRFPITEKNRIGGYELAMVSARVRIDHVARDTTLVSLHLASPWPQPIGGWRRDIAKLPSTLSELAVQAGDGAVVVGGDFNSTIDMRPFRQLLTTGYRDAAQQAGSGRNLSYPANRRLPPLIGIDHVLSLNATAVSTRTVEVPRTDHRALLTTVMIPKS